MKRNRWRKGVHLVVDDESGRTYYSDKVRECWDGSVRHYSQYESRHPQEFVRAKDDPRPVHPIRAQEYEEVGEITSPILIGNTQLFTPVGPATHLFRDVLAGIPLPGIGEMIIEDPGFYGFVVETD